PVVDAGALLHAAADGVLAGVCGGVQPRVRCAVARRSAAGEDADGALHVALQRSRALAGGAAPRRAPRDAGAHAPAGVGGGRRELHEGGGGGAHAPGGQAGAAGVVAKSPRLGRRDARDGVEGARALSRPAAVTIVAVVALVA